MPLSQGRPEFSARYLVESTEPLERASEIIAGEQSSGTFMALPGESDDLKQRSRARVLAIEETESSASPSLASAHAMRRNVTGPYRRGIIDIAFPVDNVGPNLPTLLATVAGNLFELGEITGLRLLDIDLPESYARQFHGPRFGIAGTKQFAGVPDGPLIGTIIKPSIGLRPHETAEMVDSFCAAGIDFIKDDELMADPPYAPFEARLAAVMPVIERHADRLGRKVMYAVNISGSIDEMRRRHDLVLAAGGTCVMVSLNWIGHSAVEHLRSYSELPIHGHRNGWGLYTRHPMLGFEFSAFQKIWRLAGVDQLHVNGLRNKFWEPDETVLDSARACLKSFAGLMPIMPVFSSGQWAGQAPDTFAGLSSTDLLYLAGGGIIGHPGGITSGVESLREAWQAAREGISLDRYAETHPALRAALTTFGARP